MLFRRNVDICCVQETVGMAKWLKTFWERTVIITCFGRDESGHGDAGILIKEKWSESVLSISRISSRIMMLKMLIEKTLVNTTYIYNPQVGLSNHDKDAFYE